MTNRGTNVVVFVYKSGTPVFVFFFFSFFLQLIGSSSPFSLDFVDSWYISCVCLTLCGAVNLEFFFSFVSLIWTKSSAIFKF